MINTALSHVIQVQTAVTQLVTSSKINRLYGVFGAAGESRPSHHPTSYVEDESGILRHGGKRLRRRKLRTHKR